MEKRIYNLVKEQYSKMNMSKKQSNQAILSNKCQSIIYNEWGVSSNYMWDLVNKYVKEFIPDKLD